LALADRVAVWSGSVWLHLDVDLPGTPSVFDIAYHQDTTYLGYTTTGSATASSLNTVTPTATVGIFPLISIIGSSSVATLQWIENQSTQERLYFNLAIQIDEKITIDTLRGQKRVVSEWLGVINGQPLSSSDLGAFHLLPARADGAGANTIAAYVSGTTVTMLMHWTPVHWSLDGIA